MHGHGDGNTEDDQNGLGIGALIVCALGVYAG